MIAVKTAQRRYQEFVNGIHCIGFFECPDTLSWLVIGCDQESAFYGVFDAATNTFQRLNCDSVQDARRMFSREIAEWVASHEPSSQSYSADVLRVGGVL